MAMEDLFISINQHINKKNYEHVVKVSDQVLSIAPGDEDAIRCEVVALNKNESFKKALSTIENCSKQLSIDFSFFKGYCLYRQNKLNEAWEAVKGKEDKSTMLLKSQILYRLGKVDPCVDIYQKLQRSEIDDLEINIVAGLVSAGRSSEVEAILKSLRVKATNSFELAYNTACSLVERNKYQDAEQMLLSARTVGQEALINEDKHITEDEIESELAPISVQLAYILGNTQEALESYSNIIKKNLVDDSSLAVAINNLISVKGPKDALNGLRKLDKLIEKRADTQTFQLVLDLDLKLSQNVREAIYVNRLLLLLHSNKLDQARELVSALPGMFPESIMPVILQAALHVKENKAYKAEEMLSQFASKCKSPDKSKAMFLARAQIAATSGHLQIAAESLLKIPDIQHRPATIATIVSLKEHAGDIEGANTVLDSAIQWWSNATTEDNTLNIIMKEAASFKLRHGKKDDAARIYEKLVKSNGSVDALVGLIQTTAHTDIQKAESYEKKLKPLLGLKDIDVDSLERTSGAKQTEKGVNDITEGYEVKNKVKTKKNRKRKVKYPKGFDPGNPGPTPDPERWLPKRERSSFKPKRKDKKAAQVRGSQGAVSREGATTTSSNSDQTSTSKGPDRSVVNVQSRRGGRNRRNFRN